MRGRPQISTKSKNFTLLLWIRGKRELPPHAAGGGGETDSASAEIRRYLLGPLVSMMMIFPNERDGQMGKIHTSPLQRTGVK